MHPYHVTAHRYQITPHGIFLAADLKFDSGYELTVFASRSNGVRRSTPGSFLQAEREGWIVSASLMGLVSGVVESGWNVAKAREYQTVAKYILDNASDLIATILAAIDDEHANAPIPVWAQAKTPIVRRVRFGGESIDLPTRRSR